MAMTRDLVRASRGAVLCLLLMALVFGPAGLGALGLGAAGTTCGVSCPCEDAHEEHAEAFDANPEHADGDPCEDDCPADCPNCGCCLGVAMAVLPRPLRSIAAAGVSARLSARADAHPSGAGRGVFRPPRALT